MLQSFFYLQFCLNFNVVGVRGGVKKTKDD